MPDEAKIEPWMDSAADVIEQSNPDVNIAQIIAEAYRSRESTTGADGQASWEAGRDAAAEVTCTGCAKGEPVEAAKQLDNIHFHSGGSVCRATAIRALQYSGTSPEQREATCPTCKSGDPENRLCMCPSKVDTSRGPHKPRLKSCKLIGLCDNEVFHYLR
jgi:hypothetical protein